MLSSVSALRRCAPILNNTYRLSSLSKLSSYSTPSESQPPKQQQSKKQNVQKNNSEGKKAPKPQQESSPFSDTLNLPQTEFPMRANALEREPELQKLCADLAYSWQLKNNSGPEFVLHDGPPYANGSLHIGHALNKILKDIINRYQVLRGKRVHFVPGWDCHGLPIELKAVADSDARRGLSPEEIRRRARSFALQAIDNQRETFKRWGVMGEWDNPYRTLDPEYEAKQLEVFGSMLQSGLVYRGLKPVYWSPSSRTALAEAELEYAEDHVSRSAYVGFPLKRTSSSSSSNDIPFKNLSIAIWTTTPWTLPANQAICYHNDIDYTVVHDSANDRHLIVATELIESLASKMGTSLTAVSTLKGSQLQGWVASNPLNGNDSPLFHGDHVTTQAGTGLVHTAPSHGLEDFAVCKTQNIIPICTVDDAGKFTPEAGSRFSGMEAMGEGGRAVEAALEENKTLLARESYKHKYPYDWRTKKPVMLRATKQWFARLGPLQHAALETLDKVQMVPPVGRSRLQGMLEGRSEWCISRQRVWGVPIPVFYNSENSDECLATPESVAHISSLIKEHGTDCWWTLPIETLLPPTHRGDGKKWVRGADTLDVWFDSGASWNSVLRGRGLPFPADVYLEGSDQHRGWFQSSLLTSVAVTGGAPYKSLVTHGFVLDEHGRKMSKSLGNVVDPDSIVSGGKDKNKDPAYGADVLRLWAASTDYSKDVLIGGNVLSKLSDVVRKIRNTARYLLGNLHGFDPAKDSVPVEQLPEIDRFLLHRLTQFSMEVEKAYDSFAFNRVFTLLSNFVSIDLSTFYLDVSKDRLYAESTSSIRRRAGQTVMAAALQAITAAAAPILCHTSEDIYQHTLFRAADKPTVFADGWMRCPSSWLNPDLDNKWSLLLALRAESNRVLESVRKVKLIGSSLEAEITVELQDPSLFTALPEEELAEAFGTSFVHVAALSSENAQSIGAEVARRQQEPESPAAVSQQSDEQNFSFCDVAVVTDAAGRTFSAKITATRARRHKCPRCWRYVSPKPECVCSRCQTVVASLGPK